MRNKRLVYQKQNKEEIAKIVAKAKKQSKELSKKASSVKNVDVLPIINKATTINQSDTATPASKPVSSKGTSKNQAPTIKEVETEEPESEETKSTVNPHPETPISPKRGSRAKVAPKSDTKPQNTDLPQQAGPKNKYNRG